MKQNNEIVVASKQQLNTSRIANVMVTFPLFESGYMRLFVIRCFPAIMWKPKPTSIDVTTI